MKLKERKMFQVVNRMRDVLMDSELDIGVRLDPEEEFFAIEEEYSEEEMNYAVRYLEGKGYLELYQPGVLGEYKLTVKGYEEWLFPTGPVDEKSIFVSYATKDAAFAGKLKERLETVGLRVFLAHEDIEPTAEWRDRLISDLKTCSIFIVLRTKNYLNRPYTEQECGFALALDKRILSICVGTDPSKMGFCSAFQAVSFKEGEEEEVFEYCKKQFGNLVTQ